MKKAKAAELEAGPSQDTVELNQREKDEGDLFGIRAIEAGFYAGVAQSRPTSRAGSVMSMNRPGTSNSTLVGGNVSSPLMKGLSNNNSVLSLHLGGNDASMQQRAASPASKLRPSDAELNGRRHHGAVDMALQVLPSPGFVPQRAPSPTFGGSDSESDGFDSPRSMSPSADPYAQQYVPGATIPASYHAGDELKVKSQAASFNNYSPAASPTPPAPSNPPTTKLPSIPTSALRKESRSPSPEFPYPQVRVYQPSR